MSNLVVELPRLKLIRLGSRWPGLVTWTVSSRCRDRLATMLDFSHGADRFASARGGRVDDSLSSGCHFAVLEIRSGLEFERANSKR